MTDSIFNGKVIVYGNKLRAKNSRKREIKTGIMYNVNSKKMLTANIFLKTKHFLATFIFVIFSI